ncbi:MAG: metallophosphoesterase family protein [Litoreibacter sp.]|nr:metallophosphoesterase family protein [Litoreibacter sp.]
MSVMERDLGVLEGDLLLFGGPYSNLQATEALFNETKHIKRENRICTGDLVAYCADAGKTAELVLSEAGVVIAGNCEIQLAKGADDCGCGFEDGTACDLASGAWYAHASTQVAHLRKTFAALPERVFFEHEGRRCVVIHGGASHVARFIWEIDQEDIFRQEINALGPEVDVVISGHSGIPFQKTIDDVLWVNAGVIGMPPHDGRATTRYVIASGGAFTLHELAYDFETAALRMEAVGLRQGYESGLRTGIWPSEDVLPQALRR